MELSCLFCNRDGHESKNCVVYRNEEDRKTRPNSDRFCFSCLVESDAAHYPWDVKCESNENCLNWYSTEHHALFCKDRLKGLSDLFLPKIDENLLPRFLETFEIDEKYVLALSSPITSSSIKLNHVKVMDTYSSEKLTKCSISDLIIINNSMEIFGYNSEKDKQLFDAIKEKSVIFPSKISIHDVIFSAEAILQLLTPRTKDFALFGKCPADLSFSDIIKKAPNLEQFHAHDYYSNIIYEDSWIKDLIKYKIGKNFKYLYVKLDKVEFNIKDLIKFVKKKCCKNVVIQISFEQDTENDEYGFDLQDFVEELEKYFEYQTRDDDDKDGYLIVGYDAADGYEFFTLNRFKKPKMDLSLKRKVPGPSAPKRKYLKEKTT